MIKVNSNPWKYMEVTVVWKTSKIHPGFFLDNRLVWNKNEKETINKATKVINFETKSGGVAQKL